MRFDRARLVTLFEFHASNCTKPFGNVMGINSGIVV